ncbi:MAG: tetratricopeptide repeat protein [Pirellulales bacterium]
MAANIPTTLAKDVLPTLAEVYESPDEFLGMLDIGTLNLICAVGLPGADELDVARYLAILNLWAKRIQAITARNLSEFKRNPHKYELSEAYWRMLALTSLLQSEFSIRYNQDRMDKEDWSDSRDILIHGLLGPTRAGTCSSLPVLVVAIGRRLGYPLHLVRTLGHLFVRWERFDSVERWNIEFGGNGMGHHSDDYYRKWPAEWPPDLIRIEAQRGARRAFLRNLTSGEEFSVGLSMRGHCLEANGRWDEALEAYARASQFAPIHPAYPVYADELRSKMRAADGLLSQLCKAVPTFDPNRPIPGIVQVNVRQPADGLMIQLAGFVKKRPPRYPAPPPASLAVRKIVNDLVAKLHPLAGFKPTTPPDDL